jgi:hypothetical protein
MVLQEAGVIKVLANEMLLHTVGTRNQALPDWTSVGHPAALALSTIGLI